jgi:ATPase family associated with various cellular activities (AAA)
LLTAFRDTLVLRARLVVGTAMDPGRSQHSLAAVAARWQELRDEATFPVDVLVDALGLTAVEREAVWLAAARHLDPGLGDDIRRFRGERGYVDGTLVQALAATTTLPGSDTPLDPRGTLLQAGLVDPVAPRLDHVPAELELELVPTPRLLGLLRGEVVLDPRLRDLASLERTRRDAAVGIVADDEWQRWVGLFRAAVGTPVLVTGGKGVGKRDVASALGAEAGFPLVLALAGVLLPRSPRELSHVLEHAGREARLLHALLVVRDVPERLVGLGEALDRLERPVVLTASDEEGEALRSVAPIHFAVRSPDPELRLRAWEVETSGVAPEELRRLAHHYPLPRPDITRAVALARGGTVGLAESARVHLRSALSRYGERVRGGVRLADLVLHDELAEQIEEIILAVRHRPAVQARLSARGQLHRRGIAALFDGPPGTGKTLAATVIANELDLPLYRIDVSRLVDRYVGETEKNLARLFEEAASDHAALLFDEADALFSRRVEVRDATDRSANMQTGLLLTLIEEYEGLVVLTTNLRSGMDAALMRRLAYKLKFEVPRAPERLALWQRHLDASIAVDADVDLIELADAHELSGGEIYNVVLRVLLRVGAEGTVTQEMLRRAVRHELEASGGLVRQG